MKKSLVLAMAMALGVTASAYAANPFSDVPAGHWAYDSIDKLAAAGVIDGMGDGTYQGDKTMTRYEMAQIVAKAMAKGANVDKLAAEFADELDNLGVRVANLEKKADNVKITGRVRMQGKAFHAVDKADFNRLRTDLTISGKVNEDWTYTALLRNQQRFDAGNKGKGEEGVDFQRAYVNGRIGGLKVQAGRYNHTIADGLIYDDRADGIMASYGTKKLNVTVGYEQLSAKGANSYGNGSEDARNAFAVVNAKVGKIANVEVGYLHINDCKKADEKICDTQKYATAKLGLNLSKNVSAAYTFIKASEEGANDGNKGHNVAVYYKGANKAKVGSYGLEAQYYNQDGATIIAHTMDGAFDPTGFKGFKVGAGYTLAKNIVMNVAWYDLESKATGDKTGTLFGDLNFFF